MADSDCKPKQKATKSNKKKRKGTTTTVEEHERQKRRSKSKAPLIEDPEDDKEESQTRKLELQGSSPWRNLQLVLSLQNKHVQLPIKVELAHDYVKSELGKEADDTSQEKETVSISRVIVFLNNWVHSLLISSEKEIRVEGLSGTARSCLDYKCWEIFKFCLEESLKWHVSLSFSRDFLRVINCIARDIRSELTAASAHPEARNLGGEKLELYTTVLNCISFVFSCHEGISNENLDLWVLTVESVLELVQKVVVDKLIGDKAGIFAMQFSCAVLEPFTKFLRVHPARKDGFRGFINKLLEPLLQLMDLLRLYGSNPGWTRNLLKLVEDVLSLGLFHSVHIDGFTSLQSIKKYKTSDEGKVKDFNMVVKSYHRHLFDKLEKIMAGKNALSLGGVGELFRLYVDCVREHKGVSVRAGGCGNHLEDDLTGHVFKNSIGTNGVDTGKRHCSSGLNAETRKSVFDFFVQIMEPLLLEMDAYLQADLQVGLGSMLLDVHCTFKSVNKLLGCFMRENIYIRTDDSTEGACVNFLMIFYDKLMSFSASISQLIPKNCGLERGTNKELLNVIAKELIISLRYLLDIEYEILGNDLESLWLMMFSYGALGFSLVDLPDQSLISETIGFGCQLVNLYSELRQVSNSLFALCKAVRCLVTGYSRILPCTPSYNASYIQSLRMVLCSQEFRIAISSAIKSIPEGQASGCIRQLATDISESLDWMKGNCSIAAEKGQIDLQAELLGRGLSEVYTLILDSLTVTTGNSSSVGVSLKGLVAVIRPIMSGLVGLQEDPLYEFMSIFMGSTFSQKAGKRTEVYSQWAVLLFFRLYLSSRSLQRQIISLVPPDTSRELSGVMRDSFTAYSARDWLENAGGGDESYFSWIVQPSASLLSVLQAVSNIFIADTFASCSPLVYVLNAMALQRLVDLNKLIKSFEYLLQRNDNLILSKLTDDTGSSLRRKRSRKWRRCVSDLRQEAEGLTEFIMGYLPLVAKGHLSISSTVGAWQWDFGIGSMNEKSLPSAIWWIICQNVDIWSHYAVNKKLKKFLSLLIQNSLPNTISGTNIPDSEKTVSVHQISVDLLSDAVLYEQRFARRHMGSRFCRLLEKTVSATGNAGKVDLSSPPNWSEVLNALTDRSITVSDSNYVLHDGSCGTERITNSFKKIDMKPCMEQKFFPSVIVEFTSCQNLLNFLSWMPKGYLTSQSITIYTTCILNLERSVVGSLLDCQGAICLPDHLELFRLLMSCRRALKNLLMAASEERMEARKSSHASTVFKSSFSVLWLLKSLSAVIELQHAYTEDGPSQVKDMTFSLIDHTSYVFLTLSRDRFLHATRFLKYTGEKPNVPVFHKKGDLTEVDPCLISSEDSIDAWEGVFQLGETLREQTQKLLIPLEEVQVSDGIHRCEKLSSVISCFQGFLWGLSSALNQLDAESRDLEIKSFTCKFEPICKVNLCIDTFAKFVSNFLCGLFLDDFTLPQSLSEAQALPLLESNGNFVGVKGSSPEGPPDARDNSSKRVRRKRFRSDNAFPDDIFAKVELFDQQCIKMALLRGFLGGENLEAAVFLRQLFIASSAILRLNLHFNSTSFSSSLVPIFIGISECLLSAFVDKVEVPQPFSFVWMDGIVMFLEELGNHFPLMNPNLSRNLYVKMVDLHLIAIGKCIALQGKGATLASHETDSSTKTLGGEMKLSESTLSHGVYCLNEFKARLRRSCTVYIKKPSELHLLSAVQAIERALVGVSDGCTTNYDICTGGSDGGKVSKIVAAGIDCLDLVLEFVEGRKRLSVVGRHIQSLVAGLFNIILHLQGPKIFCHNVSLSTGDADPDPGSITLMCVEVLTRVCGKHAFFQWDTCYVAQSLRMPAALFQNFLELGISDAATKSNSLKFSEIFDRQFSMDLYAACCRLLYTVLKHHKRESQQCIALLEDSVSVLLHCLETVDIDQAVGKGHPTWQVQGGVKCACSLRRIYEEIRQQKDVLGQHSFQFLSSYIWIYSGYGPLRSGIRREIDEALRPGVYALIDACSPDDLQHIHTVFGEGPCRSTLAALQHDYKQNFQYEGKV